jgi:hypothetical protein
MEGQMLTHAELVTLERSLRATPVLSVYLEGAAADLAAQQTWRVRLDHELQAQRAALSEAPHEERERFEACVSTLWLALASDGAPVRAPGWVAFITADGVRHASALLAPMPILATWGLGATVAPYLRALKESRPVVIAVMDARKASVYTYREGALDLVASLHAHHHAPTPAHMGDAPRLGFHSGTRGVAGRDALQRTRRAGTSRMVTELVDRVAALAGDDGWIVLGGIPRVVARAARPLAECGARVLSLESLDVHASTAQIADAARRGASTLRDASAVRHLDEIAAEASAGGLGVLGREATERALQRASVRTLFLSERFLGEHAVDAAALLRSAIDQDASIEEVSRAASRELDTHGGIGARLRFKPATEVDVPLATANGG